MARKQSTVNQVGRANGGGRRGRFRLLVIDDAEGIRTYLANLLELKGYQVDTAEDGRSALALLEGGAAPDVVLLDVMMPGIDGIDAGSLGHPPRCSSAKRAPVARRAPPRFRDAEDSPPAPRPAFFDRLSVDFFEAYRYQALTP